MKILSHPAILPLVTIAVLLTAICRDLISTAHSTPLPVTAAVVSPTQGLSPAYLDRPISAEKYALLSPMQNSWAASLDVMPAVVGKQVILPPGMADFLKKRAINYTGYFGDKVPTPREYLDRSAGWMGMVWSYDAERDAIVLDFPWRKSDPTDYGELKKRLLIGGVSDKWHAAFDALLSKPGNFSSAWKTRVVGNTFSSLGFPSSSEIYNFYCGEILDEAGAPHLLILNVHSPVFSPGSFHLSYYLFDRDGKFRDGGVYDAGSEWESGGKVELDAERKHLIHRIKSGHLIFAVENSRFVLKESIENGQAYDPQAVPSNCFGKILFTLDAE